MRIAAAGANRQRQRAALSSVVLSVVAAAAAALAVPAEAACTLAKLAELPVTMAGLSPTVTLKVNGVDRTFAVSSSSYFSTMSPATVSMLGLKLKAAPIGMGTITGLGRGEASIQVATAHEVDFAGVPLHAVDFIVMDRLGDAVGANLLSSTDVEYDLANGVIRLFRPDGCEQANLAYWAGSQPYSDIAIDPPDPPNLYVLGKATLNGHEIEVVLATGVPQSIVSTAAAASAGVTTSTAGVVAVGVESGVAQRSYFSTWRGSFASLKVGGEEIKNTPLLIGDIEQHGVDMMLGADFFLSHRIFVSNSQHRIYFTYNGGAPFAAAPAIAAPIPSPDATDSPTTADGFARRGAAFMARSNYEQAIADFTDALKLAPDDPRYLDARGRAELANHQTLLALADYNRVLKLKPDDVPALAARALIYQAANQPGEAKADLAAADRAAASDPDQRYTIANAYFEMHLPKEAIAELGLWMDTHPDSPSRASVLNIRCYWRALANFDVDQALIDCDAALKLAPGSPEILNSRGLAYLRLGELLRATADYTADLKLRPRAVQSLYGRGVAERRLGMIPAGDADLAAARAIAPEVDAWGKTWGLAP